MSRCNQPDWSLLVTDDPTGRGLWRRRVYLVRRAAGELSQEAQTPTSRKIRELIGRYSDELGGVSPHRGAKPTSPKGGRPEECYYLDQAQALFIVAKSETPKATAMLQLVIRVFLEATRGLQKQPAPAPRAEPRPLPGVGPLAVLTQQQLEHLLSQAALRGAEEALRRYVASRWLSNRQAAERYCGGNLNAWYCFVKRNGEALRGCSRGKGRVRQWEEAKLEAAVNRIRNNLPN